MKSFLGNNLVALSLIILIGTLCSISCGKPTPVRVVEMYLEQISSEEIDVKVIESITMEEFREKMAKDALVGDIATGSGSIYDLFVPLMSTEDARKVEAEYDFSVTTRENIEGGIALVQVYVQPYKRQGVKTEEALNSKTLHPRLKTVLSDSQKQIFMFKMKLVDDAWKIQKLTLPSTLEMVMLERSGATVQLPLPDGEVENEEAADESPTSDAP